MSEQIQEQNQMRVSEQNQVQNSTQNKRNATFLLLLLSFIIIILLGVIAFLLYQNNKEKVLLSRYSAIQKVVITPTPMVSKYPARPIIKLSPLPSSANEMSKTPVISSPSSQCAMGQLQATIMEQAGAGNIYGTLTVTNISKTACSVTLGNTIAFSSSAKNLIAHYQQTIPNKIYMLTPGAKLYSQVHYPNGPQCQSGVSSTPITFLYKTDQTSVTFKSTTHGGTLMIQACTLSTEKTTVTIWPLTTTPTTL